MRTRVAFTFAALLSLLGLFLLRPSSPALPKTQHPAAYTLLVTGENEEAAVHASCFGIVVTADGHTILATAKHVVEGFQANGLTASVRSGDVTVAVDRMESHPELDVGLLWVPIQLPCLPWSLETAEFGDRVQAAGWCFGQFLSLTEGLVANRGCLSVDLLPGASGGPVFKDGRAIGVVSRSVQLGSPFGPMPIGASVDFVELAQVETWLRQMIAR